MNCPKCNAKMYKTKDGRLVGLHYQMFDRWHCPDCFYIFPAPIDQEFKPNGEGAKDLY